MRSWALNVASFTAPLLHQVVAQSIANTESTKVTTRRHENVVSFSQVPKFDHSHTLPSYHSQWRESSHELVRNGRLHNLVHKHNLSGSMLHHCIIGIPSTTKQPPEVPK